MFGFLRETEEKAKKDGMDKDTGLHRTGLEVYLEEIFPDTDDWVHDKMIPSDIQKQCQIEECRRFKPDYRSESLKLIVEFDGLPHYSSPKAILNDKEKKDFYKSLGYSIVTIPYFIQLTKKAVKTLFNVNLEKELFDVNYPSLGIKGENSPAWLPKCGVERMARDFKDFPEQYEVNIKSLEDANDEFFTGVQLLKEEYDKLFK